MRSHDSPHVVRFIFSPPCWAERAIPGLGSPALFVWGGKVVRIVFEECGVDASGPLGVASIDNIEIGLYHNRRDGRAVHYPIHQQIVRYAKYLQSQSEKLCGLIQYTNR